ncbi:ABC transporter permease [Ktedonosporobacter rubrisoli]|uniref:ABC transporter permease n=1 Tax=Ktedonosporobacter rubrisoli TaxID=2509675 RepID=A0A4P6JS66_KTERU|nr:ABC transporter permease [Ktedonosporobacter rubrisoli]QBD78050.1 ABC transporter permease [Ktedonosporobacter rubrisoli]
MITSKPDRLGLSGRQVLSAYRSWRTAHPLIAYAIRRFIAYLFTLWAAFTVTFFFFRLIPGNPIAGYIQSLQAKQVYNAQASVDMVKYYNRIFGLDGNLFQQYTHYMYQVFIQHDLGPSLLSFPTPSQVLIMRALPWTIGLLGLATIIAWVLGIIFGALLGWKRDKKVADWVTNITIGLSHIPYYFVALILVFFLAYQMNLFPSTAAYDPGIDPAISWDFIESVVEHGLLPAFSIVVIGMCGWMLSTRMLLVTILGEDYLTFAEAKGLKPRQILMRYALRNCYLPQITGLGITLGTIFNGNVLVEQLFVYPGIGNLFVTAVQQLDYNTIQGIVALAIFGVLTANLIIDLLLPALDPRVKYA